MTGEEFMISNTKKQCPGEAAGAMTCTTYATVVWWSTSQTAQTYIFTSKNSSACGLKRVLDGIWRGLPYAATLLLCCRTVNWWLRKLSYFSEVWGLFLGNNFLPTYFWFVLHLTWFILHYLLDRGNLVHFEVFPVILHYFRLVDLLPDLG